MCARLSREVCLFGEGASSRRRCRGTTESRETKSYYFNACVAFFSSPMGVHGDSLPLCKHALPTFIWLNIFQHLSCPLGLKGCLYLQEKAGADVIRPARRHVCSIPETAVMEEAVCLKNRRRKNGFIPQKSIGCGGKNHRIPTKFGCLPCPVCRKYKRQ